ncbi:MAG: hypothetical protein Q4E75_03425 [bacterium]|nr:hypothetical protein [bacterium]
MQEYRSLIEWISSTWSLEDRENFNLLVNEFFLSINNPEFGMEQKENIISKIEELVSKNYDSYSYEYANEYNAYEERVKKYEEKVNELKEKLNNRDNYLKQYPTEFNDISNLEELDKINKKIKELESAKEEYENIEKRLDECRIKMVLATTHPNEYSIEEIKKEYEYLLGEKQAWNELYKNIDLDLEKYNRYLESYNSRQEQLSKYRNEGYYDENQIRLDEIELHKLESGLESLKNSMTNSGNVDYNYIFSNWIKSLGYDSKKSSSSDMNADYNTDYNNELSIYESMLEKYEEDYEKYTQMCEKLLNNEIAYAEYEEYALHMLDQYNSLVDEYNNIKKLYNETLEQVKNGEKWHPELSSKQIDELISSGITKPSGEEYNKYLEEHNIDINSIDEPEKIDDLSFLGDNQELEEEIEVERITPWEWVKHHKKEIVGVGLGALAITALIYILCIGPASANAKSSNEIASLFEKMKSNGGAWPKASGFEKDLLHNDNITLAGQISSKTGMIGDFGKDWIWRFNGKNFSEALKSAKELAASKAQLLSNLNIGLAFGLGLGGLTTTFGPSLQDTSPEYRRIKKEIKNTKKILKNEEISVYEIENKLDEIRSDIMNSDLDHYEINDLKKRYNKLLLKLKEKVTSYNEKQDKNNDDEINFEDIKQGPAMTV